MNFATLEVARRVPVWVAASDLSAEAWTPWIVFILDDYAYFSPNITNHLDHFHLVCPAGTPNLALPEIAITLELQLSS